MVLLAVMIIVFVVFAVFVVFMVFMVFFMRLLMVLLMMLLTSVFLVVFTVLLLMAFVMLFLMVLFVRFLLVVLMMPFLVVFMMYVVLTTFGISTTTLFVLFTRPFVMFNVVLPTVISLASLPLRHPFRGRESPKECLIDTGLGLLRSLGLAFLGFGARRPVFSLDEVLDKLGFLLLFGCSLLITRERKKVG